MKLMVGITQKNRLALFPLWSLKKSSQSDRVFEHKTKIKCKRNSQTNQLLNQFQNDRKTKIVRASSLVETFLNIKQQFEIDVDTTRLKLLRVFGNFKHASKLFQTVGVKQDNVF